MEEIGKEDVGIKGGLIFCSFLDYRRVFILWYLLQQPMNVSEYKLFFPSFLCLY